ncbi:MAG: hypothetical protein ABI870_09485 [Rhodanobacter sp.]
MAGLGWLTQGVGVGFRHPKPLFGGAALLVVAALLPSLITLPLQFHALQTGQPLNPGFSWILMVVSMVLGLLLVPLYAGYLQVIDAAEQGLPAGALDIFKPYRQGEALPLIGYGLTMLVVYAAMIGIIIAATGGGIASWYMQMLTVQANHQPPPGLPHGFGIALTLFMVLALFIMGLYAIGLGQVALRRRGVFGAVGDGIVGALKNLLPLIVFAVSVFLAWIAIAIVLVIVVIVVALLAKLVGTWLMIVVMMAFYIAMMLIMFTMMFGTMYYLWRDVCGDDTVPGMPPPLVA